MADYPDVLDHLGKTPREFGGLQVHVEPVVVDDGWGWTTLWFQAAFEPFDGTSNFTFVSTSPTQQVLRETQRVPPLDRGAVLKGQVRFKLADDLTEVMLRVRSIVLDKSQRCRPAWKLFDTFEIAKESAMKPATGGGIDFAGSAAGSLMGAPFGVAVIAFEGGGGASPSLAQATATKVHKARQLPEGFVTPVVRDAPRAQPPGDGFSVVWMPGQPLPEPPPPVPVVRPVAVAVGPKDGRIECGRCGFGGKWADYGGDKYCPGCGHEWR